MVAGAPFPGPGKPLPTACLVLPIGKRSYRPNSSRVQNPDWAQLVPCSSNSLHMWSVLLPQTLGLAWPTGAQWPLSCTSRSLYSSPSLSTASPSAGSVTHMRWGQRTLPLLRPQKVTLRYNGYIIHLTSAHHESILLSHVVTWKVSSVQ